MAFYGVIVEGYDRPAQIGDKIRLSRRTLPLTSEFAE
jgi:hypothetical protein